MSLSYFGLLLIQRLHNVYTIDCGVLVCNAGRPNRPASVGV